MTNAVTGSVEASVRSTEESQLAAFKAALRNPVERGLKVLSDGLQAGLTFVGSLVPELGWTPPQGWDKDVGRSA